MPFLSSFYINDRKSFFLRKICIYEKNVVPLHHFFGIAGKALIYKLKLNKPNYVYPEDCH